MTGSQTLKAYLEARGIRQREFANESRVHESSICLYLSGKARPGRENALRIHRATRGLVPVSAWDDDEQGAPAVPVPQRAATPAP